jgi:hypothetical protein
MDLENPFIGNIDEFYQIFIEKCNQEQIFQDFQQFPNQVFQDEIPPFISPSLNKTLAYQQFSHLRFVDCIPMNPSHPKGTVQ